MLVLHARWSIAHFAINLEILIPHKLTFTFEPLQDEDMSQKKGPTIEELVAKEGVDLLSYMGWEKQEEKDVKEEVMLNCIFHVLFRKD